MLARYRRVAEEYITFDFFPAVVPRSNIFKRVFLAYGRVLEAGCRFSYSFRAITQ